MIPQYVNIDSVIYALCTKPSADRAFVDLRLRSFIQTYEVNDKRTHYCVYMCAAINKQNVNSNEAGRTGATAELYLICKVM